MPVAEERIYGEIANPECSQVLEEMGSLAGINAVVLQSGLNNDPCRRDLLPFYRYPPPLVARTPASRADENIIPLLFQELCIDAIQPGSDLGVLRSLEVLIPHIYNIADVTYSAVAKRKCRCNDCPVRGDLLQPEFYVFVVFNYRPDL